VSYDKVIRGIKPHPYVYKNTLYFSRDWPVNLADLIVFGSSRGTLPCSEIVTS